MDGATVSRSLRVVAAMLGFVAGTWASAALAWYPTFRIEELHSSPDGMVQYVVPDPDTARRHVLIATPAFAERRLVRPDYIVPAPFLFPDGGVLTFASVDGLTYPALPTSSLLSLNRSGMKDVRSPINFEGETKFRSTQVVRRHMLC